MRNVGTFWPVIYVIVIAFLALTISACSNTVDPFIQTDSYYTIFGYLDTGSDTQYVRVVPFRLELGAEEARPLDAVVTSTDLDSGIEQEWRDSVITFGDGSVGHVFISNFRPIPGHEYRLEVERADGVASWAQTVVPLAVNATVIPPAQFGTGPITQTVVWDGIDVAPFRVEVWYRFSEFPHSTPYTEFVVTYGEEDIGRLQGDTWQVPVKLSEDTEEIEPLLRPGSPLLGVGMRLTMSDDAWRPPGGVFDPEILVQPGTFSNVEHGFGFLGSVNQYTVEWVLDDRTIERLNLSVPR